MPSVAANGITLEYEAFGNEGDPVILLIMGLGMQMIAWLDPFCEQLAAHGYRVIRFDNRDAGLSTPFEHAGVPNIPVGYVRYLLHLPLKTVYTLNDMASDAIGLLDALGIETAHVAGASMGGMIAQNLTALHPTRVRSLVSIMSTTGKRNLPKPKAHVLRALLKAPAHRGTAAGAVNRLTYLLALIGSRTHPPDPAAVRALCERHVARGYRPNGMARQLVAIAAADDRTRVVKSITRPTLVIHGAEDPLLPLECGRETARMIMGARLEVVEGMGHDLPLPLIPHLTKIIAQHCRPY